MLSAHLFSHIALFTMVMSNQIFSHSALAAASYGVLSYLKIPCAQLECCETTGWKWILNDHAGLTRMMEDNLFGQHIAHKIIVQQVGSFFIDPKPTKPFVAHISGRTGTGKNHIANLIARARYHKGEESKYVKKIIATHKYSTMSTAEAQKDLKQEVLSHAAGCKHSMFIIDEVEKLPNCTLDAISAFLDINTDIDGIDFRKMIFLFLSNTAGSEVLKHTKDQLQSGVKREDISVLEMEKLIEKVLYNKGELKHSSIISRYQVDALIPMLPLERRHVELCAKKELLARENKCGCSYLELVKEEGYFSRKEEVQRVDMACIQKKVIQVVAEIEHDDNNLFSRSGCKKIKTKSNFICPLDLAKDEL